MLRVENSSPAPDGTVTATVWLEPAGNPVYGLDLVLRYEPATATPVDVEPGPLAGGLALSHNVGASGEVRVALAGTLPITHPGVLLRVRLQAGDSSDPVMMTPVWGQVNEGAVPLRLKASRYALYLPLVTR